jgi:hypothetical protein
MTAKQLRDLRRSGWYERSELAVEYLCDPIAPAFGYALRRGIRENVSLDIDTLTLYNRGGR